MKEFIKKVLKKIYYYSDILKKYELYVFLLAFIIVIPQFIQMGVTWLLAIFVLNFGFRLALSYIKTDFQIEELIERNKSQIKELDKNIKDLEEKLAKEKKLGKKTKIIKLSL